MVTDFAELLASTRGELNRPEKTGNIPEILFTRNEIPMDEFCKTSSEGFDQPPVWNIEIPLHGRATQHLGIMNNFADAILEGTELIAPAREGIHSVELANAMLMSSFEDRTIELPLDGSAYETILKER